MNLVSKLLKGFTLPTLSLEKVKNQKGLTLVELLAIIVIIAVIGAIAIPTMNNVIRQTQTKAHRANAHMLVDTARNYMVHTNYAMTAATEEITLAEMITAGLIQSAPVNPYRKAETYKTDKTLVEVTKTTTGSGSSQVDKFSYKVTLVGGDATKDYTYLALQDEAAIDTATVTETESTP
jgi:type IV pilus assembly protein PilA